MEQHDTSELDPKKVENLHRILAVFDTERLTPKDFIAAFKQVIDHVKNTQNLTLTHLQAITQAVHDRTQAISEGNRAHMAALQEELASHIAQKTAALEEAQREALERLDEAVANVKDGEDADEAAIVEKVLAQIPPAPPALVGEDFRNALEALNDDDRLDPKAIRGLTERLEKVEKTQSPVIGNNPGVQVDAGSGIVGRFQTLKFPNATVTTSNTDASISFAGTGTGTVTSVSVVSANGLAGSVATATTTPAITLSTTVTGVLKGNGTAISAATANTDYQSPITLTTTGTSGAATFNGTTLNIPQYSAGGGSGITRSVNVISTPTTAGAAASTDYTYIVTGTTTLTMPTAIGNTNRYTIKNAGANTVTIAFTSAQTADGSTTLSLTPNTSLDLISTNTNWVIV